MQWITLFSAVVFNTIANLIFKRAMIGAGGNTAMESLRAAVRQPWLWIGVVFALLLLASYLLTLRHFHVSLAYSLVTGLALALMTILSSYLFGDRLGGIQLVGIAFVIIGVALLSVRTAQ